VFEIAKNNLHFPCTHGILLKGECTHETDMENAGAGIHRGQVFILDKVRLLIDT
jgi:hypothetical protein